MAYIVLIVDEALTLMERNSMDVVFMDIRIPGYAVWQLKDRNK